MAGLKPDCGGGRGHGARAEVPRRRAQGRPRTTENLEALETGLPNLLQHVENITNVYSLPCVVAINAFPTDTKAELDLVEDKCRELGVNVALSEVWAQGRRGRPGPGRRGGRACARTAMRPALDFHVLLRADDLSIEEKIERHRQAASTMPTAWCSSRARAEADRAAGPTWASATCPSAWPRPSTRFSDDATKLGAPTRLHRHGAQCEGVRRRRLPRWPSPATS